jgi:hypothetical protein
LGLFYGLGENLKANNMKIKEPITMAFLAIFKPKKHKELTKLIKLGLEFKYAIHHIDVKKSNKIDKDTVKSIDLMSKIADVIIEDSKKRDK